MEKLYQDDLLRIGALVELQAEIVSKRNTFHEVALELLHNLIYLKDTPDLGEEFGEVNSTSMQSTSTATSSSAANASSSSGAGAGGGGSLTLASKNASPGTGGSAAATSQGQQGSMGGGATSSNAPIPEIDTRNRNILEKDPLTLKLELMEQLVASFFVLGKSAQAINMIIESLRSELRHIIQKAVATVKKRHESNPVLLQQILSRPNRGPHAHDYPNLFLDMLQIVFTKAKQVLIFHRCVTNMFEAKMREEQLQMQAQESSRHSASDRRGGGAASSSKRGPSSATNGKKRGRASSQLGENGSGSNNHETSSRESFDEDSSRESFEEDRSSRRNSFDGSSPFTGSSTSSSSTYRLEHVWEEFQKELQALIGYYIAAPSESSAMGGTLSSKKSSSSSASSAADGTSSSHQGSRLFSFSSSSAFTLYEVSETQSFTYRNMDLGDPSPYNLPALYPLISNFCELGTQIVASRNFSSRLQEWLDGFVATSLLAVVKMDYKKRIETAIQSGEAFKSRDSKVVKSSYSAEEGRRPLLNSATEVFQCVKELYEDSVAIPMYATHIHSVMETCLMTYYDACKAKFDEYVRDSEVAKTVRNPEFQKLVLTNPQWKRIIRLFKLGGTAASANANLAINLNATTDSAPPESTGSSPGSGKLSDLLASEPEKSEKENSSSGRFARPHSTVISSATTGMMRVGSGISEGHGTAGLVDAEETEYTTNLMDFESAWHTGTTNAGVPISGKHMILDPTRLVNLAALHDSCYWIADKVALLEKMEISVSPSSLTSGSIIGGVLGSNTIGLSGNAGAGVGSSGSGGGANQSIIGSNSKAAREAQLKQQAIISSPSGMSTSSTPATPGGARARTLQRRDSKEQFFATSSLVFHPKLSTALSNLTWMYKDLSDQCLHNIYVDFRLQTCYFLDGLSKSYVYAAEDRQPDVRVVDLNTSLANSYALLSAFLPSAKLRYLLGGLPLLMSALLIESLKSRIEAINRNGVVKMVRNIFALQQNLTGMTTFNETPFDKARRYYELLNSNIEEVYAFVARHHQPDDPLSYSLNQYRTVLEIIANPKSRTLTDEQEKDLRDKFVLEPASSYKRSVK